MSGSQMQGVARFGVGTRLLSLQKSSSVLYLLRFLLYWFFTKSHSCLYWVLHTMHTNKLVCFVWCQVVLTHDVVMLCIAQLSLTAFFHYFCKHDRT